MGVWGEGEVRGHSGKVKRRSNTKHTHSRTSRSSSPYIPTHQKTISFPQTLSSQKAHTHTELEAIFSVHTGRKPERMGMWVATPTVPCASLRLVLHNGSA